MLHYMLREEAYTGHTEFYQLPSTLRLRYDRRKGDFDYFTYCGKEVGKEISGIRIRHIDELEAFCEENKPKVAVLCVPRDGAQQVSGRLVDLGIEGFWNFSHYDLSVPYPDVVVENVHLGDSLMSLGYRLRNQE